jgi:hypothetical protein
MNEIRVLTETSLFRFRCSAVQSDGNLLMFWRKLMYSSALKIEAEVPSEALIFPTRHLYLYKEKCVSVCLLLCLFFQNFDIFAPPILTISDMMV